MIVSKIREMEKTMIEPVVEYQPTHVETSLAILKESEKIVIGNQEQFKIVASLKSQWKEHLKNREAYWEPLRENSYLAYQSVLADKRAECDPLKEAIERAQKMMDAWATEQKRLARIEQEKLEAIAKEKAEKERLKLLEQAIKLQEKGQIKKAEAKLEQAEQVFIEPVFAPSQPKTIKVENGVSITCKNDIEVYITDVIKIAEQVGKGVIPSSAIEINMEELRGWIKSFGKKGNEVPGMTIREIVGTSVRGNG